MYTLQRLRSNDNCFPTRYWSHGYTINFWMRDLVPRVFSPPPHHASSDPFWWGDETPLEWGWWMRWGCAGIYLHCLCFSFRIAGSCRNAYYCPFHAWSGWSGSIAQGTCGRQSRYRDYNPSIKYEIRSNNCNGISSSCGSRQYNYRNWCKLYLHSTECRWNFNTKRESLEELNDSCFVCACGGGRGRGVKEMLSNFFRDCNLCLCSLQSLTCS